MKNPLRAAPYAVLLDDHLESAASNGILLLEGRVAGERFAGSEPWRNNGSSYRHHSYLTLMRRELAGTSIPSGPILIFITLILMGVFWLYFGLSGIRSDREVRHWPETRGTLLQADVTSHSDPEGSDTYSVDLAYHYTVGNRQYTGTKFNASVWDITRRAAAERIVENLQRQQARAGYIPVWYSPRNPALSVVNRDASSWSNLLGIGIGVFVLMGLYRTIWPARR